MRQDWSIIMLGIKTKEKRAIKMKKAIIILASIFLLSAVAQTVLAHQPRIIYFKQGDINIDNPEVSQVFYDKLSGQPRNYFINSDKDFNLYINLLVPEFVNANGRYSANVFLLNGDKEQLVVFIDGFLQNWEEFYEPFARDYYLKGPEFEQRVLAGNYRIEVFSEKNWGEYVLTIGKDEVFAFPEVFNIYWQLPLLKLDFFKTSVLQFFLTPFGIAGISTVFGLLIVILVINFLIAFIRQKIENRRAKTILLTSVGMQVKEEIKKMLRKPAYDILVGFITTASKYNEDASFVKKDLEAMKEMGFNIEEIDIEGKKQGELKKLLDSKDIVFVEGGNAFFLLKCMRESGFEKVMRKLLKRGVVYIGVSAGSIVAGQTIETVGWNNRDKNTVGLKNLKGLRLVPFNVFVHYQSEQAEMIKQNLRESKHPLRILTDEQAILVQGRTMLLLGKGEEVAFERAKK
ncbi:MAG: hypothetical protein CEN87_465 [Parcubacteria group bacterium Licking1014_1]|nr:MAG: hypothetical protein CEN87_465 [Parcubacteria group bacterium Licking1014_1]